MKKLSLRKKSQKISHFPIVSANEKVQCKEVEYFSSSEIILNANKQQKLFFMVNDQKIKLKNTCPFDALIEVLISANKNYDFMRSFIDKNTSNDLLQLVQLVSENLISKEQFYERRAEILYPMGELKGDTLDCADNPVNLAEELFKGLDLLKSEKYCNSCNFKKKAKPYSTLRLEFHVIQEYIVNNSLLGMKNLRDCLIEVFSETAIGKFCPVCKMELNRKLTVKDLLIIETEDIFRAAIEEMEVCLNSEAPCFIEFDDMQFQLVGAVQRKSFHYVGYCYVNGIWEVKDDMQKNIVKVRHSPNSFPDKINTAALFYCQLPQYQNN